MLPAIIDPKPVILDQNGFPISSAAEFAEEVTKMSYAEAQEAIYLLQDQVAGRNGLFADEDRNWLGLSLGSMDADRDAIDWDSAYRAAQLAYRYWIHNPVIKQGVQTTSEYVFGRGVNITSEDEGVREKARDMWGKPDMQRVITGGDGLQKLCSLTQVFGNLFLLLTPGATGMDRVRVRPMSTIERVALDEWGDPMAWLHIKNDPMNPGQPRREWVKSLLYWEREMMLPEMEQRHPVNMEYAMQHISMGSLIGVLGLPTFWSGIPWAKAYKESLEDFAVVQRALRTFAWRASGSGYDGVQNMRNAVREGYQRADRDAYGAGRTLFMPSGDSAFAPIRTANYQTPADGSRRLLLMACASFGLPETYFGDVSVGTYATAATMERPVELRMKAVQDMWSAELERMLSFLIDGNADNEKQIEVNFPDILEHEAGPFMQAMKAANELSHPVMTPQDQAMKAMMILGFDDVEDKVRKMDEEGMFDVTRQEEMMQMQQKYAPEPAAGGAPGGGGRKADQLGKDRQRADAPKGAGMPRPDRS